MEKIIYEGVDYTKFIEFIHYEKTEYAKLINGIIADYFTVYVTMIFANTDENGKMGYDCELNLGNTNRQIADLRYFADMLIDLQPEANTGQPVTPEPETTEGQLHEQVKYWKAQAEAAQNSLVTTRKVHLDVVESILNRNHEPAEPTPHLRIEK
jgi:hypothetical protein